MAEFYFALFFGVLNIVLPYAVTRRDRRRLDGLMLERAWNGPSWACAVYFFGPLCLPAHFWVTRRSARGLLQGAAWTLGIFAFEWLLGAALDAIVS
jgi:hypothetical protein